MRVESERGGRLYCREMVNSPHTRDHAPTRSARAEIVRTLALGIALVASLTPLTFAAPEPVEHAATRLLVLGTGAGPVIRRFRSEPANALVIGDRVYLIDAGEGVSRQLISAGLRLADVDRVFLTHLHFDHTAGLASLMAFDWATRRTRLVEIFGPPGTQSLTRAGLAYFAIPEDLFAQQLVLGRGMSSLFEAHDVDLAAPTEIYHDERLKVIAVENSHYSTLPALPRSYGPQRSYSYRFETPDRVIVFTGDTGPSEAVERLARGADVLVSEVIDVHQTLELVRRQWQIPDEKLAPLIDHMAKEHLRPEDLGAMAARAAVKLVVLTHFAPGTDAEVDPTPYVEGVRRHFSGPVIPARDLDEF